jgi:hypothetical protein
MNGDHIFFSKKERDPNFSKFEDDIFSEMEGVLNFLVAKQL